MSIWLDRADPGRTYVEIRFALPRSPKQILRVRRWRKFARTLPPGTNVTQVFTADALRITGPKGGSDGPH